MNFVFNSTLYRFGKALYESSVKSDVVRIALGGLCLGMVFSANLILAGLNNGPPRQFSLYLVFVALYHILEFLSTACFRLPNLKYDSYLLNHSKEYLYACAFAVVEYAIEFVIFCQFKTTSLSSSVCLVIGIVLCSSGQYLRTSAMVEAGSNFTHIISTTKKSDHQLIQSGIYSIFRHPSYVGWFYWSLGTQFLLFNPFSLALYAYTAWNFFKNRIEYEEALLHDFFQKDYSLYSKKTIIGIPFISGYEMK